MVRKKDKTKACIKQSTTVYSTYKKKKSFSTPTFKEFKELWFFFFAKRQNFHFNMFHVAWSDPRSIPPPFSSSPSVSADIWHQYRLAGPSSAVLCWTAAMLKWPNSTHSLAAIKAARFPKNKKKVASMTQEPRLWAKAEKKRRGGAFQWTDVKSPERSTCHICWYSPPPKKCCTHLDRKKFLQVRYAFSSRLIPVIINSMLSLCFSWSSINNKRLIFSLQRPRDRSNQSKKKINKKISLQTLKLPALRQGPCKQSKWADLAFNNPPQKNIHKMIATCVNMVRI